MRGENAGVCPPVMPAQAGIQYSETPVIETKTRGVLDTRLRGYDEWWVPAFAGTTMCMELNAARHRPAAVRSAGVAGR
jgi:hypothetical protein